MGAARGGKDPWVRIAGVAEDASYEWVEQTPKPAVYLNAAQIPPQDATYALVTDVEPLSLAPAVRKALAGLDPALPLDGMMTYEQFIHEALTGLLYAAAMLAVDAAIALLLAAIGIFAVMANMVAERTREIGVRLAMGARREDVMGMILRRAAWLTGIGVGAGLLLAFGLAHGVASLLYGVSPNDPAVFGSITAAIVAIALLASWLPARRAARIDPMVALRDD
jgi:predicted lysophospholipase L1 biosynthesis ABC-type transport system permease subunit